MAKIANGYACRMLALTLWSKVVRMHPKGVGGLLLKLTKVDYVHGWMAHGGRGTK